ncbi:MAG: hypothetical protein JWQ87_2819 [Candidatus Sulfotelmatobacter sp.]|nr:hypothetical protein [Candidatus Sulfotelmatobacter sp.]
MRDSAKDSAILPGMPGSALKRQSIAIVGAGNLAGALATSLHAAGYRIDLIISRSSGASLRRARRLARQVGASAVTGVRAKIQSQVVWFCVPDSAIAGAAESLLEVADWKNKVALHSSGALNSDELNVLRGRGAAVASVHPLMTFVNGARPPLATVPFALEGDRKAVVIARSIVRDLRGVAFNIRKQQKGAYHAWGMFLSPLLTALLAASENVAAAAGVRGKTARERMLPILQQTLANYARLGAAGAFSGPLVRGDADTVKKHLKALQEDRGAQEIYIVLARAALGALPAKNRAALRKVLKA